jgi:hypothetical protein
MHPADTYLSSVHTSSVCCVRHKAGMQVLQGLCRQLAAIAAAVTGGGGSGGRSAAPRGAACYAY